MRWLPMYPELPVLPVEREASLAIDEKCDRCDLHKPIGGKPLRSICMRPEGKPGGVLFVSDYPGDSEDLRGRPFVGEAGKLLRYMSKKYWDGPVAFDNALKCKPGRRTVSDAKVRKCRGYLAKTIRTVRPERIVCMGKWATYSVLGRTVPILSVRGGWGWYCNPITPVFIVMNPAAAVRNDFMRAWFEEDIKNALTCDVAKLEAQLPWDAVVNVVETEEDALAALEEFQRPDCRFVCYDIETAGLLLEHGIKGDPIHFPWEILCVGLCSSESEDAWVWDEKALANPKTLAVLKRIMEDPKIKLAATNEKFDRKGMQWLGIEPRGFERDARLEFKILDPAASAKLKHMQELVGYGGGKEEMDTALEEVTKIARKKPTAKDLEKAEEDPGYKASMRGSRNWVVKNGGTRFRDKWHIVEALRAAQGTKLRKEFAAYALVDPDLLVRYNGIDVRSTKELLLYLDQKWEQNPQLRSVWTDLVHPANSAVARVESTGFYVNKRGIRAYKEWAERETARATARIKAIAPNLDPSSPEQLAQFLFDELKLPVVKETSKGARSTDRMVLDALKGKHPIVEDIITHRGVSKQGGTYADTFKLHVRADGRIHSSLLIDGAETGRMSSADPNLQNIPRAGSIAGALARSCFGVPPGFVLVQFDYSQLELRVAAMESGDQAMIDIFRSGVDFHLQTAKMISKIAWNVHPDDVGPKSEYRSLAKAVNFGALYGKMAETFAREWNTSVASAEKVVNAIMGNFPDLARYMKDCLREARRTGYCWTTSPATGERFRRRPLWKVRDRDSKSRSRAEHGSWNTPIQGKASDFCLFSLVALQEWLDEEGIPARIVLTVHDSILLEVPFDYVDEVLYTAPLIMSQWKTFGVPLVIDSELGPTWGELYGVSEKGDQYLLKVPARDTKGNIKMEPDDKGKLQEVRESVPWRQALESLDSAA